METPPKTPDEAINTVSEANSMLQNNLSRRRGAVIGGGGVSANGKNAAGLVALSLLGEDKKKKAKTESEAEEKDQAEGNSDNGEDTENAGRGTTQSSPEPMQRRRANVTSLKINDASKMMRFGVRPHTSDGGGSKKVGNKTSPSALTNIEAERIRKKMLDKSLCLRRERADRAASAVSNRHSRGHSRSSARAGAQSARSINSSSAGFVMDTYNRSRCNSARPSSTLPPSTHTRTYFPPRTDHQKKIMASYITQCRRGQMIPDVNLAKKTLLLASKDHVEDLQKDVKSFVLR